MEPRILIRSPQTSLVTGVSCLVLAIALSGAPVVADDRMLALVERFDAAPSERIAKRIDARAEKLLRSALARTPRSASGQREVLAASLAAVLGRERVHGASDPHTLAARLDAARLHLVHGWTSVALTLLERALADLGGADRTVLHGLLVEQYGLALAHAGDAARARVALRTAVDLLGALWGEDSPATLRARLLLAETELLYGNPAAAAGHGAAIRVALAGSATPDELLLARAVLMEEGAGIHVAVADARIDLPRTLAALDRLAAVPRIRRCIDTRRQATAVPPAPPVVGRCPDGDRQVGLVALSTAQSVALAMEALDAAEVYLARARRLGSPMALATLQTPGLYAANASLTTMEVAQLGARGQYNEAIEVAEEAAGALRAGNGLRHPRMAHLLTVLASLQRWAGRPDEAAELERAALTIRIEADPGDLTGMATSLVRLGSYYARLGDEVEARRFLAASETIYTSLGEVSRLNAGGGSMFGTNPILTSSPVDRAHFYFLMGDYVRARAVLEAAVSENAASHGEAHVQTLRAQADLAGFHADLNQRAVAVQMFRWHVERLSEEQLGGVRLGRIALARLARLEGRPEEALARLRVELARTRQDYAPGHLHFVELHRSIGLVLLELGRAGEALEALRALAAHPVVAADPRDLAAAQVQMARAELLRGDVQAAVALLDPALVELSVVGADTSLWNAESAMSAAMLADGNAGAAVYFGKLAVNRLQRLRGALDTFSQPLQEAFLEDKRHVYRNLAEALIESGRLGEAQAVLGLLKTHEYDEFLLKRDGDGGGEIAIGPAEAAATTDHSAMAAELPGLLRDLRVLRRSVHVAGAGDEARRELRSLRAQLAEHRSHLAAELVRVRAEFAAMGEARLVELGEKHLDSLGALQGVIRRSGDDVALLHYLVLQDKVRIIVTTADVQTAVSSTVDRAELNGLVFGFRAAIDALDEDAAELGKELHDLLIAPVAPLLREAGAATLLVSLDGVLRYLPLPALHDGTGWLAERYQFALFTPAGRLALERPPAQQWRVAAFGVSAGTDDWSPLPAVPAELAAIVDQGVDDGVGVLPGMVLLDERFTRAAFAEALDPLLGDGWPVVHIASHFNFVPGRESASYLVTGDGGLSVQELQYGDFSLQDVDLLTLSACNSGLSGLAADGSEIEGFAALAQNKGAAAVLATLWPVADSSTALFMRSFYATRQRDGVSKAAAIQQVQRAFIASAGTAQDWSMPFYWAPFMLLGNWQ